MTIRDLLRNALRMRPDRLVVGEVRGAESLDLLLALTSGHRGCLATCHASDAPTALNRLALLAQLSSQAISPGAVRRLATDGIDVVVCLGRREGKRCVTSIKAVGGGRTWTIGESGNNSGTANQGEGETGARPSVARSFIEGGWAAGVTTDDLGFELLWAVGDSRGAR